MPQPQTDKSSEILTQLIAFEYAYPMLDAKSKVGLCISLLRFYRLRLFVLNEQWILCPFTGIELFFSHRNKTAIPFHIYCSATNGLRIYINVLNISSLIPNLSSPLLSTLSSRISLPVGWKKNNHHGEKNSKITILN